MSLIDVFIEVAQHPLAQRLAPYVLNSVDDNTQQRRLDLYREDTDRQIELLRVMASSGSLETVAVQETDTNRSTEKSDDLYSRDNRYDTGCVVCGKAHLAATVGMLDRAAQLSQERGSCDADCAYYLAAAQREVVNLLEHDWTPEQVAATPPEDRAVLEKWLPALYEAQNTIFLGTESPARVNLAKAAGALEEAGRFARSSGVDHPEAQKRIADAEKWLATTERAEWSPERRTVMDPAVRTVVDQNLPKFRAQRQFLLNGIQSPEDLDRVAGEVGVLNAQIQGVALRQLTPDQVQTMAGSLGSIRQQFRQDLDAQRGREHHG